MYRKSVGIWQALDEILELNDTACSSCNSSHIEHTISRIGAIIGLFRKDGGRPANSEFQTCEDAFRLLGIPYIKADDGMILWGHTEKLAQKELKTYYALRTKHGVDKAREHYAKKGRKDEPHTA